MRANILGKTTGALLLSLTLPTTGLAADDAREAVRRRIDLERSQIVLAAKPAASGGALDADAFVATLLATTGARTYQPLDEKPAPPKPERKDGGKAEKEDRSGRVFDVDDDPRDATCGVVRGKSELHALQIRLRDGSFLVRDAGTYGAGAGAHPDEAKLASTTRRLLAALGASGSETSDLQVRTLMAGKRVEERPGTSLLPAVQAGVTREAIGKKVFVRRTLGGIPVAGNGAVASFGLDGGFRKLRGRWTAVDARKSQLASDLDETAFVERALDVLLERGLAADSDLPIYLETYFRPRASAACGTMTVDLRGLAYVQTRGPDGEPGRVVQLDFDV